MEEEEDKIGEKFLENWEEKLRLLRGKSGFFVIAAGTVVVLPGRIPRACVCACPRVCAFMKIVGHRRGSPVPWSREDRPRKRGQKMVPGTKWYSKGNDQSGLHGQ